MSTVPVFSRSNIANKGNTNQIFSTYKHSVSIAFLFQLTNHQLTAFVRESLSFAILQCRLQLFGRDFARTIGIDGIEHALDIWSHAWR